MDERGVVWLGGADWTKGAWSGWAALIGRAVSRFPLEPGRLRRRGHTRRPAPAEEEAAKLGFAGLERGGWAGGRAEGGPGLRGGGGTGRSV